VTDAPSAGPAGAAATAAAAATSAAAAAAPPSLPRGDEIDAISLDLDDTLWPVVPALIKAEQAMHDWLLERAPATAAICSTDRLKEIRLLLVMANAERAHDLGWLRLQSLREALKEGGDDPALAVGAFNVFLDGRQRVTLYDDVEEVLRRWKSRYKLLVVTNGNADIERIGIAGYFDVYAAAHELGVGKPDPHIFEQACSRAGVVPSRVLHVGDDFELDVLGARSAGMHAAWLRRPDLEHQFARIAAQDREPAAHLAEPRFDDLRALDRALERP
jgi:FMN phosphatase YigB (HAD superfamily)